MNLSFEPRHILANAPEDECLLVLRDKRLVALLIRVDDVNGEQESGWFIDWAAIGEIESREIFHTLESASDWICRQLDSARSS